MVPLNFLIPFISWPLFDAHLQRKKERMLLPGARSSKQDKITTSVGSIQLLTSVWVPSPVVHLRDILTHLPCEVFESQDIISFNRFSTALFADCHEFSPTWHLCFIQSAVVHVNASQLHQCNPLLISSCKPQSVSFHGAGQNKTQGRYTKES